jgi:ferric-dicitrate binding protein FerR (iron transport regulator)
MNDQQIYDPIEQLITRYLSGNVTEAEISELEAWVQAGVEHRTRFMESRSAWILSGMADRTNVIDEDTAWGRLAQITTSAQSAPVIGLRTYRKLWRIAAAVVIVVLAGSVLYQQLRPHDTRYLAEGTSQQITLKDGTQLTLNRNSELIWLTDYKNQRVVSLKGDAYFDVVKDATKPFVVTTTDLEIEVLGTAFYVDARPEQPSTDITVEHGRVAVRHNTEEVELAAEEKATFDKVGGRLEKLANADPNFTSVKTQMLQFKNSRMETVVATLNRHYHARIIAEPSVQNSCELTATFENKSLEAVLQIIASTMDLEIINQNQYIILRGSCTLN